MKRLIVAYDSASLTNFNHASPSFTIGDVEVLVHASPYIAIDGDKVDTNFDLLIQSGLTPTPGAGLLEQHQVVDLPRHAKSRQVIEVNRIAEKIAAQHYLSVLTRYCNKFSYTTPTTGGIADLGRHVVIKPEHGARGIGQYVVDTHAVSIENVLKALENKLLPSQKEIQQLFPKGVFLATDKERSAGVGQAALTDQNYIVQGIVPSVVAEVRVLLSPVSPNLYIDRTIIKKGTSGVSYSQATGADGSAKVTASQLSATNFSKHFGDLVCLSAIEEIEEFLDMMKSSICPFGSVDLFVTETGDWGVFEYGNQFGSAAYHPQKITDLHQQTILHWLGEREFISPLEHHRHRGDVSPGATAGIIDQ